MERVVENVKQEKLGAASVVSMLRGKGVKAEEIKWSGIEQSVLHEGQPKYSREPENDGKQVAWAVDNGVITEQERVAFFRMIANIKKPGHKVRRTSDGGYIIDLGNKLLFTDGDWRTPSLSSVVVFNDTSETSMEIAKDVIFNGKHNKARYEQSRQIIEDSYWPGYVERYTKQNSTHYAREDAGRKGADRGADHGGTGNKVSDTTYSTDYAAVRNKMKGGDASRELDAIAELQRSNAKLKEVNQALKEQFRLTKFAKVDKKALEGFTKKLLKDYRSGADVKVVDIRGRGEESFNTFKAKRMLRCMTTGCLRSRA